MPAAPAASPPSGLIELLRCLECHGRIALEQLREEPAYPHLGGDGLFRCQECGESYPLIAGTVRMLPRPLRARLALDYPEWAAREPNAQAAAADDASQDWQLKQATADSFAYEWQTFGGLREQWRKNFVDYLQPHSPSSLRDHLFLDVGTGSGRHAYHAAAEGARVAAVDLGRSIDIARANLPPEVLTVQADADHLPFAPERFDFVNCLGVLHHLPKPQRALTHLATMARPGGHVHIYVYWVPARAGHRAILRAVSAARIVAVRMPHRLLHALCFPLAAVLAAVFVGPYRLLRTMPRLERVADAFPLKAYADYPFGVLVNDQFDRFSAPVERRYTEAEVVELLRRAGVGDIRVIAHHGWIGDGRRTAEAG